MLAIGSDHAGYALKQELMRWLDEQKIPYHDYGCYSKESTDYAKWAYAVGRAVADGEADKGVLVCGTGVGMSMAANKIKGIRAACCSDYFSAKATRSHNDANILCMGERVVGPGMAVELLRVVLETPFEGGRHQRRVDQIAAIENGSFEG